MTARRLQSPMVKNGPRKNRPIIQGTEVERLVSDFRPSLKRGFTDAKVQVHFKVSAGEAKVVAVAGTFNGWDPKGTPLNKAGDAWDATIALPRGRYEYRFVVDGKWLSDPNARESVRNPFGSQNSVLTI